MQRSHEHAGTGRQPQCGPHGLDVRHAQTGQQADPLTQGLGEIQLAGHGPGGDRGDLLGHARAAFAQGRELVRPALFQRLRCSRFASGARTIISSAAAGSLASWVIESMFPPTSATHWATWLTAPARNGWPMTIT